MMNVEKGIEKIVKKIKNMGKVKNKDNLKIIFLL